MRHLIVMLFLLAAALFTGCTSEELAGTQLTNQPPTVWLSSAPPEGSVSNYTLQLFWGGWDPDGEISHYEYAITNNTTGVFDPADTVSTPGDNKWNPVFVNDSIFLFSADVPFDSTSFRDNEVEPEEFRRSHTFFIRAVDEQGTRSITPAYRSFTSRTLSPVVRITVPAIKGQGLNASQVPPITTFRWAGTDFVSNDQQVQDPDSVRWIIVPRKRFEDVNPENPWLPAEDYPRLNPNAPEWSRWHYYQAPGDTGTFFTTPPLDFGNYLFAVQVKDEAGAVNPVFDRRTNMARFLVSPRSTGPILTVRNEFLGTLVTSSPNSTPSILDLPAGVPMQFEFEADASGYGGIVSGYRFGWDILDLNDDEQWEIDFTPFIGTVAVTPTRTFFFSSHTFHVETVDNSGFKSRISVTVNVVPFTMERPLRFIDDVVESKEKTFLNSNGALASDGERDAFWAEVLSDVQGFEAGDIFSVGGAAPTVPITEVADYQNVIWNSTASHNFNSSSVVAEMVTFKDPNQPASGGKTSPNIPALYMAAGGHLLLVGQEAMTMVINRFSFQGATLVYPIIFRYELTGDQDGSYTSDGNDVGRFGVGQTSFAYKECCLNVLDIAYIQNSNSVRKPPEQQEPPGTGCPVNLIRQHSGHFEGIRSAAPIDQAFPRLNLRPEAAGDPSKFYHESRIGLNSDIYNPQYFANLTACESVSEFNPPRSCFQPIYGLDCLDQSSVIFGAPIAFWTTVWANRVPDVGGVAARSAVWGFQPVFMNPDEVKTAIAVIVHDEWKLLRKSVP